MRINLCDQVNCPLYYKDSKENFEDSKEIVNEQDDSFAADVDKIKFSTKSTIYINLGYIEFPIYCLLCKHAKKFDVEKLLERKEALDLLSK